MGFVRAICVYLALGTAACYSPKPQAGAACTSEGACPTGLTCIGGFCVEDTGPPNDACNNVPSCAGGALVTCGVLETCALGCSEIGGAHCEQLAPSNGITTDLLNGATAVVTGPDIVFDTDTGRIHAGPMIIRPPGTGTASGIGFTVHDNMGVFTASSFALNTSQTWTVDGGHTIVLYAATTISIAGTIDVGAVGGGGGPGGANANNGGPCRGGIGTWTIAGNGQGGGGAGGATAGGHGGAAMGTNPSPPGQQCMVASTRPLRGGSGGANGGVASDGTLDGGRGGAGGGAIALVAMGSIDVTGVLASPGTGGVSVTDGGGGGGAGGAIFLEAPLVTMTGTLTANGGGGGGPSSSTGERGHITNATPANGGSFNGVSGGKGGAGTTFPTDGGTLADATTMTARGAGGGGSVGRIEVRAIQQVVSGLTSPAPAQTTADLQ